MEISDQDGFARVWMFYVGGEARNGTRRVDNSRLGMWLRHHIERDSLGNHDFSNPLYRQL